MLRGENSDDITKTPHGDFLITFDGLSRIASAINQLDLPTVIIQEGGYNKEELWACASHFLSGFGTSGLAAPSFVYA
jgi:acetoin utilization deacetylase AcuC-like enzyme